MKLKNYLSKVAATVVLALALASTGFAQYCTTTSTYACTYMYITNVTLNTINNSSGCSGAYENYTGLSTNLTPGSNYAFSINGYGYPQKFAIYIDLNNDNDFLDANEMVYVNNNGGNYNISASFTCPNGTSGSHRLRVISDYEGSANLDQNSACAVTYGQAEDYTVNFPAACANDAGIAGFTSPSNPACAGTQNAIATIKNYGNNTLSSATINWTINGAGQTAVNWTGSLAPNATANVTLGSVTLINGSTTTLSATSSNPNGTTDCNNANNSSGTLSFNPSLSGTYTIGSGGNYTTFAAALNALATYGVCGPVIFNVAQQTFNEVLNFPGTINGSSATNTITFRSNPANTANPVVQVSSSYVVNMSTPGQLQHIYFEKLNLINQSASYGVYIYESASTSTHKNIRFKKCLIQTPETSGGYPVYAYRFGGIDLTLDSCTISGGYYGILWNYYSYTSTYMSKLTMTNSTMEKYYYYGLYGYGIDGNQTYYSQFIIKNNQFTHSVNSATVYSLYCQYGGPGCEYSGNRIDHTTAGTSFGMYLTYHYGSTAAQPMKVHNNIVNIGNATSSGQQIAFYGAYDYYAKVYHNTFRISNAYTSSQGAYIYFTSSNMGCEFKNNIMATNSAAPYTMYMYYGTPSYVAMNDNVYFTGEGNALRMYQAAMGSTSTTIEAWQSSTTQEASSLKVNPDFVSAVNFTPQSITVNNSAASVGITTDYFGAARSATVPDPGAIEFTIPDDDARATALTNPGSPNCADSGEVKVAIKNVGLLNLTSVEVHLEINGVAQPPLNWTGNLTPGSSDTVTVASAPFIEDDLFKAWTAMPNGVADVNAALDTVSRVLKNGLDGIYTIASSGGDFANFTEAVTALNERGVCGPVVFHVAQETFTEQIILGSIVGVSAVNTVTFMSNPANTAQAVLANNSTSANYSTVRFSNASYITFDNIEIRALNPTYAYVLEFPNTANYITVKNSTLRGYALATTGTNQSVIYNVSGGLIQNTTFENNRILGGSYSVYWYGAGTGVGQRDMNNKFINNQFLGFYYYGAYFYYQSGLLFEGNVMESSSAYTGTIYGYYGIYIENGSIVGNDIRIINGYGGYGIMTQYFNSTTANPVLIANNFLALPYGNSTKYGMQCYYNTNCHFIHNSVNISTGYGLYAYQPSGYGDFQIKNNSFAVSAGGYALARYDYVNSTADNNNLFAPSGNVHYNLSTGQAFNTLALYQATGYELNSISADPMYVTPTDLHSCAVALHDAATVTVVATDIDGQTRGALADIGADEFMLAGSFSIGPNDTVCATDYEFVVEDAYNYLVWYVDGVSMGMNSPFILNAGDEPTTYHVEAVANTSCGTATGVRDIRLVPNAASAPAGLHLCAGEEGTLTANGGSTAVYLWSASGETTKAITVDESSLLKLTKTEEGCTSSAWVTVTQSEAPSVENYYAVCPDELPFAIDATIAHGTTYTWSGGAAPTAAVNTFAEGGEFTLIVDDSLGCTTAMDVAIEETDVPKPNITVTNGGFTYEFVAAGASPGANATYMWVFSDEPAVVHYGPTVTRTFPFSGVAVAYMVTLSVSNECGTGTKVLHLDVDPLGVDNTAGKGDVVIYPNPAQGRFTVVLPAGVEGANIEVVDITGRTVKALNGQTGNTIEVDATELQAGSYLVRTTSNSSVNTQTIIIQ